MKYEILTATEAEEIYQEGYTAYFDGKDELYNPYDGLRAEHFSDGYCDAQEDDEQREDR
ncbi:hypothetical protein HWA77_17025 [Photobacterium damselae subsp. damselae]|uniref:Uncharacterized protein n=1 Tax=Photobacterium damselae subsp. damselae TaxID=85581 RepID=A0A850QZ95_PHODD|nr:hypothetical protein [Photobacterium damselae subsp. damselae]